MHFGLIINLTLRAAANSSEAPMEGGTSMKISVDDLCELYRRQGLSRIEIVRKIQADIRLPHLIKALTD